MHANYSASAIRGEASIISFDEISPSKNQAYFTLDPGSMLGCCSLLFLRHWPPLHLEVKQISVWQDVQPLSVFSQALKIPRNCLIY